ncbi:NHL repeat-containing protein [Legionella cincinnatiensis]|uniref:Transmembrane protein n=1 Tax=Legionella cincinnatiensis TaxID=28085 RepID=A0A378IEG4_9GAMM|nr:NHL repeat-containing protein [Legionella cincinnatiensis]KTC92098.1 transmembrane protein [Legionella cincinnatiensis]STX33599.1 transmembrane protein [Legionella cincinnatiensis]
MNKNKIAQLIMILMGWLVILVQANASLSIIPNKNCLSRNHLGDCIVQMTAGSNVPATVTIFNNSKRVTASNIRAILPSDWTDVSQDASNCAVLPPQKGCVLKFLPGNTAHTVTSIPIVGTRTSTSYIAMEVVASAYTIGGSISGLTTSGLILQNNGSDNLSVPAGATSFQFSTPVAAGGSYDVTIVQQPTGLTCTINNASGTDIMANVTNISIVCSVTTYTIGGSISGLTASGLVLQNNGGDNLSVPANATSFQFATPIAEGGSYAVTIQQQPTGLTCTIDNATGSNVMANVTDISIVCSVTTYTIGGSISGLTADGLVLQNNGGDNLSVPANATSFQFSTPIAEGGGYEVTVLQQPSGLKCSVNNGSGSNVMADVTDISVTCVVLYTYVTNSGANTVSLCNINQTTGVLTCPGTTGSGFNNPRAIHINPTGTFAYIVNQNNGLITLCNVNQTSGTLNCPGTTGGTFQSPIDIAINPAGTMAYVTNSGNNTISHCVINQTTGELTCPSTTGSGFNGPGGITVNPAGTFAYIVNELANNISACVIDQSTGNFTSCAVYAGDFNHPNRITLNPGGNFAYVSNGFGGGSPSEVFLCSIEQSTGGLTCPGTTGSGFNQPFGITINSANTIAYIANSGNSAVSLCNITQSTGELSCPGTTGSGFNNPTGIAITGNL